MSIAIGFYELFAYTVPGVLYLYVINEVLRLLNLPYVDISQLTNLTYVIILAVFAYTFGHLFDFLSSRIFRRFFIRPKISEQALINFNNNYPEIEHKLLSTQVSLYLRAIQFKNPNIDDKIQFFNAVSIMLRNISFGLLLLAILYLILFFVNGYLYQYLLVALFALIFSIFAILRSRIFYIGYYGNIIRFVLNYGSSLSEIFPNLSINDSTPPSSPVPPSEPANPPS